MARMRVNVRVPEHEVRSLLETIIRIFGDAARDLQAVPVSVRAPMGMGEWIVTFSLDRESLRPIER